MSEPKTPARCTRCMRLSDALWRRCNLDAGHKGPHQLQGKGYDTKDEALMSARPG